ncbi:MAG: gluconate:H+ symporter [Verrucomicrobiales bacterium]
MSIENPLSVPALLGLVVAAVIVLVALIGWVRINAFLALLFAALLVGLGSGMAPAKVASAFQDGMGATLGSIAGVLGLGTILGGLLAVSGGAEVLAKRLVQLFGPNRVNWCLMSLALAVGLVTWFAVGLVMLLPILLTLARETKQPFLKLAIPMLACLSVMHGVMPPHPGPLIAIAALDANLGLVLLWGAVVGLPVAVVAGPLFACWAVRHVPVIAPEPPAETAVGPQHPQPGLVRTVAALALPILLLLSQTAAELWLPKEHIVRSITALIGNPTVALGIAVLFAAWAFGFTRIQALSVGERSLGPVAMTLLVVGGGGGFNRVLKECGAADAIGQMATAAHLPPMIFGWLSAALIRVATGSATVAITAASGLVAPLALQTPGLNIELLVVAIGCGSLFLSHLNDGGFWIVKDSLGLTVGQTLRTWTVSETIVGIVGLAIAFALDLWF